MKSLLYPHIESLGYMLFTLCIILQELKIINILHNRIKIIETERQ